MSGTREGIAQLYEVAAESMEALETAAELEAEAARLRREAPSNTDQGIVRAASLLVKEAKAGVLTPREALEAALDINQFTPSNVIGHKPPDKEKYLGVFDQLSETDTPFILPDERITHAGFTTSKAPKIRIVQERAMGGLPNASMVFGSKRVRRESQLSVMESSVDSLILTIRGLGIIAAGATAIQERLDAARFVSRGYACGHGHRGNEQQLTDLRESVDLLADVGNYDFSTDVLDVELEKAATLNENERRQARREADAQRRRHDAYYR